MKIEARHLYQGRLGAVEGWEAFLHPRLEYAGGL